MGITVTTTGPVDENGLDASIDSTAQLKKGVSIDLLIDHLVRVREEMKTSGGYSGDGIETVFAVEGSPRVFTSYCISHSNNVTSPVVLRIMA